MLKYKDIITTPTKPLLPDITVCTECEHDSALPRIDRQYFLKELNNKWLEKTVHNTILGLFVAPGKVVYQYINYDREQIIKPIAYLLLMSVIFLWSLNQFDKNFDKSLEIASDLKKNMHWIQFIQAIFMAWVMARWTYKDSGYNFYECAVLTTYLQAQIFLLTAILMSLSIFVGHIEWLLNFSIVPEFLYTFWGITQFFHASNANDYKKAIFTLLANLGFFLILVVFIALLEIISKSF